MKKVVDDLRLMIKVCDMYYNQNISQQEIASLLKISRPTLSRLLTKAKEQKLIRFELSNVEFVKYWELSENLKSEYHLRDVIIADSSDSKESTRKNIGKIAASYLEHTIKDKDVVGISMGSTLSEIVHNMRECDDKKIKVLPLIGGIGQASFELHANTIVQKFANAYHSEFQPIFVPARVFSKTVRNELLRDVSVSNIMNLVDHMNIAILGIGYPNEYSSINATGYFAENEMEMLIDKGVAGEINMQFFDEKGDTSQFKDNNYVVGVEVQKFKKIPISIGAAGGTEKVKAIRAAICGGYINTLITDYQCAKALLDSAIGEIEMGSE